MGLGSQITDDRALNYQELAEKAYVTLDSLFGSFESPLPYYVLLMISDAIGLPLEDIQKLSTHLDERFGDFLSLEILMLLRLSEKWGGSHKLMLEYAKFKLAKAAPGSSSTALVAVAYDEFSYYLNVFEDDPSGGESFFKDEKVQSLIYGAL